MLLITIEHFLETGERYHILPESLYSPSDILQVNVLYKHAIVTGASGSIGRALVGGLIAQGWSVTAASRRPCTIGASLRQVLWSLSKPLATDLNDVDVVFHCASATITARRNLNTARELDFVGTHILVEQCRAVSRNRTTPILFVFLSSQSASPEARNVYGRSKFEIEQLLTGPSEVIVRPGLVYGDVRSGIYGTLIKLIDVLRVLPTLGEAPCIQPIYVVDLIACLMRIADRRAGGMFCLGRETPLAFPDFCRRAAARENLQTPIFAPLIGPAGLWLLGLAANLGMLKSLNERVQGLIALKPMSTAADLARLGIRLHEF